MKEQRYPGYIFDTRFRFCNKCNHVVPAPNLKTSYLDVRKNLVIEHRLPPNRPLMINFDVLLDDLFWNINTDDSLALLKNERIVSFVNDYEDGRWRFEKFQNFVWDNIADTALSYRERQALINNVHTTLTEAAKKLRLTDSSSEIGKGSELAEIVLYGIMKHHYEALSVVPKIFYVQDNAKGADSVHIILESETDFSLWFGEAKFYNSLDDSRLTQIIDSIENSLQVDKLKKENSIITGVSDLTELLIENKPLYEKITKLLSPQSSIDLLKPKLNIPILLLHECPITAAAKDLSDEYKKELIDHHKERAVAFFNKQINKLKSKIYKYEEIKFHIILFPVPKKDTIVNKFVETVKLFKT